MRLLVLVAIVITGCQGSLWDAEPAICPERDVASHATYTGTSRGVNKLDTQQAPRFGINSEIYDSYEPGEMYEFELGQSETSDEVTHFYLISAAVDPSPACPSLGSWQQPRVSPEGPQPKEGCDHVLEYLGGEQRSFHWMAPDCGCVTISAVVVNQHGQFFADDDSKLQGPLTMTLCAEEEKSVPSLYDDDFYGIEEDEDDDDTMMDEILDEVNDIITCDLGLLPLEEEIPASEEEETQPRRGRGKGRGKGKGRGRWMRRNGREEDEDDQEEEGKRRKPARGKFWKRRMGRKTKGGEKTNADKSARLQKVCRVMELKSGPMLTRSSKKSKLTDEALQVRRERWASFREDMLVCCREEGEDEAGSEEEKEAMVQCVKDAHGRRIAEKMCGSEDEHFKTGEMPEKIRTAQEKCCESEGEEKKECLMDALKVMRKLKRQQKRNAKMTEKDRVATICSRVEKRPVPPRRQLEKLPIVKRNKWTTLFTERRLQMSECCKLAEEEQESCLVDVREQRQDRVCAGEEELTFPWSKMAEESEEITEACCILEDTERYTCFAEKMPNHRRGGHRRHHRRGHKTGEVESMEEGEYTERTGRRSHKKMMGKRARGVRRAVRKQARVCCQGGRKAGTLLEEITESKWRTCHEESTGYVVDKSGVHRNVCQKSFRKCCMKSAIRQAGEEAVAEAEEEEDMNTEDLAQP